MVSCYHLEGGTIHVFSKNILKAQADNCSSFDRKLLFFCFSMCVSNFIIKNA
jgi:hypothetical protein